MSEQSSRIRRLPGAAEEADRAADETDRMVTVLNSDPFLRTIDFGTDERTGERRRVSIPAAQMDGFRHTTPGRTEMPRSDWDRITEHPSARFLVRRGTLSLLGIEG